MSEEKKCIKNEDLCEENTELSIEELEQVTGGVHICAAQMDGFVHGGSMGVMGGDELIGRVTVATGKVERGTVKMVENY